MKGRQCAAASYLAPGLSTAVPARNGCRQSSSCGSQNSVSPTSLWEYGKCQQTLLTLPWI